MDLERFKSDIIPLRQKLLFFAIKMMGDNAEAEDIVQETFLRLWNHREQLGRMINPAGFAMQTTKNICIDKLRAQKITLDTEDAFIEEGGDTPYTFVEKQNALEMVRLIIQKLPELQRRIIMMRDVEGYELEEIAEITGTQVSAVTMNLSRARKKVKEKFISIQSYKMNDEQAGAI